MAANSQPCKGRSDPYLNSVAMTQNGITYGPGPTRTEP